MDPLRLSVFAGNEPPLPVEAPVLFRKGDVLYADPNPDRTRKNCGNCIMFLAPEACFIHDADVVVTPEMVCGYHVYGEPMPAGIERTNMMPVKPETSGLVPVVRDGSSCDTCEFFMPINQRQGLCRALCEYGDTTEESLHPTVDALGCCARWSAKPTEL